MHSTWQCLYQYIKLRILYIFLYVRLYFSPDGLSQPRRTRQLRWQSRTLGWVCWKFLESLIRYELCSKILWYYNFVYKRPDNQFSRPTTTDQQRNAETGSRSTTAPTATTPTSWTPGAGGRTRPGPTSPPPTRWGWTLRPTGPGTIVGSRSHGCQRRRFPWMRTNSMTNILFFQYVALTVCLRFEHNIVRNIPQKNLDNIKHEQEIIVISIFFRTIDQIHFAKYAPIFL